MNEKIKQFAVNANHYASGVCDTDPDSDWCKIRDQKFAELIVRECVNITENNRQANRDGTIEIMLKHFGVE